MNFRVYTIHPISFDCLTLYTRQEDTTVYLELVLDLPTRELERLKDVFTSPETSQRRLTVRKDEEKNGDRERPEHPSECLSDLPERPEVRVKVRTGTFVDR